jgi:hypothetical protein
VTKPNIVFGLVNIACALLFIGISIPLIKRKIKMNSLYGIRIKKSFQSEDNWCNINEYGGKELIIWSIPIILAGLILFILPVNSQYQGALSFILGIGTISVCVLIAVIRILVYAKKV